MFFRNLFWCFKDLGFWGSAPDRSFKIILETMSSIKFICRYRDRCRLEIVSDMIFVNCFH